MRTDLWTDAELQMLRDHCTEGIRALMALLPNRSYHAITCKASHQGIPISGGLMGRPGRASKRFCVHGHDTEIHGRSKKSRACLACMRLYHRRRRGRTAELNMVSSRPLRAQAENRDRAAGAWLAYRRVTRDSAEKAADRLFADDWLDIDRADRWCIALNTHLSILYPELYVGTIEEAM